MAILTMETYRSKGINAYLVPLHGLKFEQSEMDFGRPATDADKAKAHKSKAHNVTIDLTSKLDGYYRYKQAAGHRVNEGYLLIRDGVVQDEWGTEEEYAIARANSLATFPALEGAAKQVEWATAIRAKVVVILGYEVIDNWSNDGIGYQSIAKLPHARDWIESCGGSESVIARRIMDSLTAN